MQQQFAIALHEHRVFKYLASPVLLSRDEENDFYISTGQIFINDIELYDFDFSAEQKHIIKLATEYNDPELLKVFSKERNITNFYKTITDDLRDKRIRPYIERRIFDIIATARENNIKVFLKTGRENNIYNSDRLKIMTNPAEAVFNFVKDNESLKYFLTLIQDNKEMSLNQYTGRIICNEPCMMAYAGNLFYFNDIDGKKLLPFFLKTHISIPKSAEKKYFETFVLNSIKKYKVNAKGFDLDVYNEKPIASLSLEKDWKESPVFVLKFRYKDWELTANNSNKNYVKLNTKKDDNEYVHYHFIKILRDFTYEKQCCVFLTNIGLVVENKSVFKLPGLKDLPFEGQRNVFINWINEKKQVIESAGFIISQGFFKKTYFTGKLKIDFKVTKKLDWFDVRGLVHFGQYTVPFVKLRRYILNNINEYELPNGEIVILPDEWFSQYKDYFIVGEEIMDHLHIPEVQFNRFYDDRNFKNIRKEFTKLIEREKTIIEPPSKITATLRNYQLTGFSWLYSLREHNFGGCLADDMGLGKTLQTLSLLVKAIDDEKKSGTAEQLTQPIQLSLFDEPPKTETRSTKVPASLIVMPTSLLFNWENEIQKFAPKLRVKKYLGANRKKLSLFESADLIIASYGIVRNDYKFLSKYEFFYIVLDESQNIKNPDSKLFNAITELKTKHRLILTGTPIENSLTDLWAQMEFLNSGLLGGLDRFKNEFQIPIERYKEVDVEEKLKKLIQPFILRRTKEEVATDLPPLNEHIRYCTMYEDHHSYYEEEKSKIRNHILEAIEEQEEAPNSMLVLQALTRLRQLANHPKLIDTESELPSAKFEEVTTDIENLVAENHKTLIFSSFVKHLNLFEAYFAERGWKYSKLTGQTRDRKTVIEDFQNDKDNFLFLISLKAGGTGLNLTEADYVIILDPWWNPAAEMQAISRAHRIGQDKKVFVYRYITRQSIEEKINLLQKRKLDLANTFVNSNNPFKSMSKHEIRSLFV